jgi:hypothetical protein
LRRLCRRERVVARSAHGYEKIEPKTARSEDRRQMRTPLRLAKLDLIS